MLTRIAPRTLTSRRALVKSPPIGPPRGAHGGRGLAISWRDATGQLRAGFADVQPRFVYCVSLRDRTLDDVFAGFNQLWRRNVRKAEKSGGVVRLGSREDLADFHRVYVETAERDHFTLLAARCTSSACGMHSIRRPTTTTA